MRTYVAITKQCMFPLKFLAVAPHDNRNFLHVCGSKHAPICHACVYSMQKFHAVAYRNT